MRQGALGRAAWPEPGHMARIEGHMTSAHDRCQVGWGCIGDPHWCGGLEGHVTGMVGQCTMHHVMIMSMTPSGLSVWIGEGGEG